MYLLEKSFSDDIGGKLKLRYEEVMWLASRPGITAGNARAWYSAVISKKMQSSITRFTGKVSQQAVLCEAKLVFEHFEQLQKKLTDLIARHVREGLQNSDEFVQAIFDLECVNIVTDKENHDLQKKSGNYTAANVTLVDWQDIELDRKTEIWNKKIKGKVSNAAIWQPQPAS